MSLRGRMAKVADRLIAKHGDNVDAVTVTMVDGATEFDPPTSSKSSVQVGAVVSGVSKWDVNDTILMTDLKVSVSGLAPMQPMGGVIEIDGVSHTIVHIQKVMASGVPSLVKYFVRG